MKKQAVLRNPHRTNLVHIEERMSTCYFRATKRPAYSPLFPIICLMYLQPRVKWDRTLLLKTAERRTDLTVSKFQ